VFGMNWRSMATSPAISRTKPDSAGPVQRRKIPPDHGLITAWQPWLTGAWWQFR
jgi:hypothetical protein